MTQTAGPLFSSYELDAAYDEMFDAGGTARGRTACALLEDLLAVSEGELRQHQTEADKAFLAQGITFTVYGDDAGHRAHLSLRPAAAHHHRRRVADARARPDAAADGASTCSSRTSTTTGGSSPKASSRATWSTAAATTAARCAACTCTATSTSRSPAPTWCALEDGSFVVLEDNLRVPSGVSYMLANREVMKRVFPRLFDRYDVQPDRRTTARRCWRRCARSRRPRRPDPTFVVLTPGVGNSAYFEHAFLARQMGIELVEGRDLLVHDNVVYMRTTAGLRRVDVIYRRVDDDFLDPLAFRADSHARRAGPAQRLSRRQRRRSPTRSAPASPTTRRSTPTSRRSSATTSSEEPILPNVETYLLGDAVGPRATCSSNLDQLVVKAVGESGGYGMLIGPHSTARERERVPRARSSPTRATSSPSRRWRCRARPASSTAASSRGTSTCGRTCSTATA